MRIEENIKALRIRKFCFYMMVKNIVGFFYLNRQCRPRCRLVQGLLLIFFLLCLKTFHKKQHVLANRNPFFKHPSQGHEYILPYIHPSIQTNSCTYIHPYINLSIQTPVVLTYIRISINPNKNCLYRLIRTYIHPSD